MEPAARWVAWRWISAECQKCTVFANRPILFAHLSCPRRDEPNEVREGGFRKNRPTDPTTAPKLGPQTHARGPAWVPNERPKRRTPPAPAYPSSPRRDKQNEHRDGGRARLSTRGPSASICERARAPSTPAREICLLRSVARRIRWFDYRTRRILNQRDERYTIDARSFDLKKIDLACACSPSDLNVLATAMSPLESTRTAP